MSRLIVTGMALALALATSCSDDAQPPATPDKGTADKSTTTGDKGTTTGDKGTTTGDKGTTTGDKGTTTRDKGTTTADKGTTTADKGAATPPILTSTHTGWKKTDCATAGCHTLPVAGHTTSNKGECAKCHGGNGACNPNGPNSGKKNHTPTLTCTGCHQQKHGFPNASDCQNCHFAAKGVVDC